jgi:hypothetical protein
VFPIKIYIIIGVFFVIGISVNGCDWFTNNQNQRNPLRQFFAPRPTPTVSPTVTPTLTVSPVITPTLTPIPTPTPTPIPTITAS